MATADVTPPSGSLAARLDGCPTGCGNAEVPYGQFATPVSVVGMYLCADCGRRWHTSWHKEAIA